PAGSAIRITALLARGTPPTGGSGGRGELRREQERMAERLERPLARALALPFLAGARVEDAQRHAVCVVLPVEPDPEAVPVAMCQLVLHCSPLTVGEQSASPGTPDRRPAAQTEWSIQTFG